MLIIDKVTKYFGSNLILNNISFSVGANDSLVIFGNNGAGKTTLLKIINGTEDFEGKVSLVSGFKNIGWLKQEIAAEDLGLNVLKFIEMGRNISEIEGKIADCYTRLAENDDPAIYEEIEKLNAEFEAAGGYNTASELHRIIKGCGISDAMLEKKLSELSGGQKSRIAFAQLLYSAPDVLLLDEPTNHLDAETKEWIMDYIGNYKGAVISISHDEEYLKRVSTKVLYIDTKTRNAELFAVNYSEFLEVLERRDEYLVKTLKSQMKKVERMEDWVHKMKGKSANIEKQVTAKERALNKFKETLVEPPQKAASAKISFNVKTSLDKSPISVSDLCFGYDARNVIHNVGFSLYPEERFIIVGKNGVGKTTLLKLIAGKLKPKSGEINLWNKTTVGYYSQEQEDISNDNTVLAEAARPELSESEIRASLGMFNFKGDKVFQSVATLSPGERARLALLKLCMKKANLLLLDEPTNHIDISTKRILAGALKNYKGTILMVSHDLEFLKDFAVNRMLLLPSGRIMDYDKDVVQRYHDENEE